MQESGNNTIQRLSIRPSKTIRTHETQSSTEVRQNPVTIFGNGREDIGMMEQGQLMEQRRIEDPENRLDIYAHLAQAAEDVRLGRVQPAQDVFSDLLDELKR